MDFEFTEEQKKLREEIHDFFRTESVGELEDPMITHSYSPSLYQKVVARGWVGLAFPKEYGGLGLGPVEEVIFNEEVGYASAPISLANIGTSVDLFGTLILQRGSEQQKKDYLPRITRGEIWGGQCFTEPEAGSDLASIGTRAVRSGDYYIVNGQKMFITGGHRKHHIPKMYLILMAKTKPDAPPGEGISLFVVDLDASGFKHDRLETIPGWCTNMIYIDDCRISKENLVGEENHGWEHFLQVKSYYWDRMQGWYNGNMLRNLEDLVQYTKETHGGSLSKDPLVRQKLADLATKVEILRLLTYRTASMRGKGLDLASATSIARYFRDTVLREFPNIGMDILGHYGQLTPDSKYAPLRGRIEYFYKNNVYYFFAGAGPLLMPTFIATEVLGLPGGVLSWKS